VLRGSNVPAVRTEESVKAKQEFLVEIRPLRRIIVVRSGPRAHLALNLDSPYRLKLKLDVEGLTPDIARYSIAPEIGETPFVARLDITANPRAMGISLSGLQPRTWLAEVLMLKT